MKTSKLILLVFALVAMQLSFSQTKKKDEKKETTTKKTNDNYLDLQTKSMTKLFGSDLSGNPDGKSIGYLEFLEKMDLPPEQKTELRHQYILQSKTLTQKQKDSLGQVFARQLEQAQKEKLKN
ncbi:MAG: hypothetical protein WA775_02700 [Psychroserpens sp.]|uniref:hypothetical protein n=1 Tax=Psychroserpens sp. TaxID=2020870 RepID=UPI003C75365A